MGMSEDMVCKVCRLPLADHTLVMAADCDYKLFQAEVMKDYRSEGDSRWV